MKKYKREAVTASFHFLQRQNIDDDHQIQIIPFSTDEFEALASTLKDLKPLDLTDEKVRDRLRFRSTVPIEGVETLDQRTLFGRYRASYWGHAYDNTERGKIPADSISLRPFYFLVYFSESGRIYIGSQYLGQFGSYTGLKNTILSFIQDKANVAAHSFRTDAAIYSEVEPKEVIVHVSRKPSDIASDNTFADEAMITIKKGQGSTFSPKMKKSLIPFIGTSKSKVQKAAADILRDSKLIDVNDEDIKDCTIIGEVNGKTRRIYMIGESSFASQFPLEVTFNEDGHPESEPTKKAMIELLKSQIVSKKENV